MGTTPTGKKTVLCELRNTSTILDKFYQNIEGGVKYWILMGSDIYIYFNKVIKGRIVYLIYTYVITYININITQYLGYIIT